MREERKRGRKGAGIKELERGTQRERLRDREESHLLCLMWLTSSVQMVLYPTNPKSQSANQPITGRQTPPSNPPPPQEAHAFNLSFNLPPPLLKGRTQASDPSTLPYLHLPVPPFPTPLPENMKVSRSSDLYSDVSSSVFLCLQIFELGALSFSLFLSLVFPLFPHMSSFCSYICIPMVQ